MRCVKGRESPAGRRGRAGIPPPGPHPDTPQRRGGHGRRLRAPGKVPAERQRGGPAAAGGSSAGGERAGLSQPPPRPGERRREAAGAGARWERGRGAPRSVRTRAVPTGALPERGTAARAAERWARCLPAGGGRAAVGGLCRVIAVRDAAERRAAVLAVSERPQTFLASTFTRARRQKC